MQRCSGRDHLRRLVAPLRIALLGPDSSPERQKRPQVGLPRDSTLPQLRLKLALELYRLVNVSVNPSGRFGAPETEPGPSGVGRWVEDELIRISFHRSWQGRVARFRATRPCRAM